MNDETIQVYCPRNEKEVFITLPIPKNSIDLEREKVRDYQGYKKHYETNFFYNSDSDIQLLNAEIYIKKDSRGNMYIFEIWDWDKQLFCFFCKNELQYFHLMQKFLEMRQRAMEYEKDVRFITNDDKEKFEY